MEVCKLYVLYKIKTRGITDEIKHKILVWPMVKLKILQPIL
jgi:hypothetical protein